LGSSKAKPYQDEMIKRQRLYHTFLTSSAHETTSHTRGSLFFDDTMEKTGYKQFQSHLRSLLQERGWSIAKVEPSVDHPWFLETWTLHSIWSPTDTTLYLVFEHDDSFHWVALSQSEPLDHLSTPWEGRLYLKRGWERDIPDFLQTLDTIRTNSATRSIE
jgi:hypothetical protein